MKVILRAIHYFSRQDVWNIGCWPVFIDYHRKRNSSRSPSCRWELSKFVDRCWGFMRSSQSQRQARGCRFSRNTRRVCLTFMECKSIVYNAAKDGKLHRLRTVLDPRSKEEVEQLVSAKTSGATPLIMACRNGHLNIVEYLFYQCHAPIEETGSVTFDGETIDGAPPLWCAAAAGFLNIVKLLIEVGADVNKTTYTNSTPLRAACFDGHFDIVQFLVENNADVEIANRHGHTCLMIACYKGHQKIVKFLLDQSADVNRKSLKGVYSQ